MNTTNRFLEKAHLHQTRIVRSLLQRGIFILFVILFPVIKSQAQDTYCYTMGLDQCVTDPNETVKFIPDEYSPIVCINLNFHFYQNGDVFNPMNFAETWDGITVGQQADGNQDGILENVTGQTFA